MRSHSHCEVPHKVDVTLKDKSWNMEDFARQVALALFMVIERISTTTCPSSSGKLKTSCYHPTHLPRSRTYWLPIWSVIIKSIIRSHNYSCSELLSPVQAIGGVVGGTNGKSSLLHQKYKIQPKDHSKLHSFEVIIGGPLISGFIICLLVRIVSLLSVRDILIILNSFMALHL